MKVSAYDRAAALVLALVICLIVVVVYLSGIWASVHVRQSDEVVPLEMVTISGGFEDGALNETLDLKSPEEISPDPTLAELRSDDTQIEPLLDTVIELSENATAVAEQELLFNDQSSGNPGSADGSGQKALGFGAADGGVPREQRWFIHFADAVTAEEYASQLDFFGIELGVLLTKGELAYISNMASRTPNVRRADSGAGENRLYMNWQGGGRQEADLKLVRKAGIEPAGGALFHFYPQETEQMLATLEHSYRGVDPKNIRRTYFSTVPSGQGYQFVVKKQTYFR
ncbi:hypothetical protein V22_16900 [Calycomorphotria hydatis]|uniref:Uncharacterized protein n=2 Tax=Calycomorphotria hydatis TaxID=2528027 RepID=A0A517T7V3_9PLAN|nr:hypothetical protein V22_16900 [Calycomorphotria hydatis]